MKKTDICISNDDTASKQLALLMVCAVFRHIGKIAKSSYLLHCVSVSMEQLSYHWTYFHEI